MLNDACAAETLLHFSFNDITELGSFPQDNSIAPDQVQVQPTAEPSPIVPSKRPSPISKPQVIDTPYSPSSSSMDSDDEYQLKDDQESARPAKNSRSGLPNPEKRHRDKSFAALHRISVPINAAATLVARNAKMIRERDAAISKPYAVPSTATSQRVKTSRLSPSQEEGSPFFVPNPEPHASISKKGLDEDEDVFIPKNTSSSKKKGGRKIVTINDPEASERNFRCPEYHCGQGQRRSILSTSLSAYAIFSSQSSLERSILSVITRVFIYASGITSVLFAPSHARAVTT